MITPEQIKELKNLLGDCGLANFNFGAKKMSEDSTPYLKAIVETQDAIVKFVENLEEPCKKI